MVPGPIKAVVLLFPIEPEGEEKRKRDDARIAKEGQPMLDNTVFWVKQTVSAFYWKAYHYETDVSSPLDTKCMWDYWHHTRSRECV